MRFELTGALINDILFFMENQDGEFLLDTREAMIVSMENDDFFDPEDADEKDEDGEDRYISLPGWDPSDGYHLMEHFTSGLRSPALREELSSALNRSRGVFRSFKDILDRHPETEKLWFNYKDREMKREIIAWYNALRESWGMELIGSEPEETESLVLEDFRFRDGNAGDSAAAAELHRLCDGSGSAPFPGDLCIAAESSGGDFAACICAEKRGPAELQISALEVKPEFRGMGLGEALLVRLIERAGSAGISIDLPAGAEYFSRVLAREGFAPVVTRYCRGKGFKV